MIKTLPGGLQAWNQEFACQTYDTKIILKNKKTDLIEEFEIGELYEKLNKLSVK
jgi:hypothetical protein